MRGWGFRRRNFQSKHNDPNLAYTLLAVRAFIGKKVNVDIACYSYGFCYPDENILVDVTDTEYIFMSDEIESEDHLWRFPINDDNCTCVVSLA